MMEEEDFRNYCVIKTFGVRTSDMQPYLQTGGVSVEFTEDCLDGTVRVVNTEGDREQFNAVVAEITAAFKDKVYAEGETSLAERLVEECRNRGITLAVAESLTVGMICSAIVDVPGASAVLSEGFVTYTNAAKVRRLHVRLSTIESEGAVSAKTAGEMAKGLIEDRTADVAISTTGCAGPDSDENDTPVGLAFVGVTTRTGGKVYRLNLSGERNYIRKCVANTAMFYALKCVENKDKEI